MPQTLESCGGCSTLPIPRSVKPRSPRQNCFLCCARRKRAGGTKTGSAGCAAHAGWCFAMPSPRRRVERDPSTDSRGAPHRTKKSATGRLLSIQRVSVLCSGQLKSFHGQPTTREALRLVPPLALCPAGRNFVTVNGSRSIFRPPNGAFRLGGSTHSPIVFPFRASARDLSANCKILTVMMLQVLLVRSLARHFRDNSTLHCVCFL